MSEFNEPWDFIQRPVDAVYGDEITTEVVDSEGCLILAVRDEDDAKFVKRLERIAACVNACAGIVTEKLIYLRAGILSSIAADAEDRGLKWRKEPPDRVVLPKLFDYWWVRAPNGARFIVKVEGETLGGKPLIYRFGSSMPGNALDYVGYQWAGPIEPPDSPA